MKYLLIGVIVTFCLLGYLVKKGNDQRAEINARNEAYQQKLHMEKKQEEIALSEKLKKADLDNEIKAMQQKITIDYADAKRILESEKMDKTAVLFYADFGARWSDALRLASSTGRIALAQPVKDLQVLKREFEQHKPVSYCEIEMYKNLSESYDHAIEGFLAFMQQSEYLTEFEGKRTAEKQHRANVIFDYCKAP